MFGRTQIRQRIVYGFMGLALFVSAGCQPPNAYQPPPLPTVTVSRPVRMDVTNYLEATGSTEALEFVEIRARVDGFLDAIYFNSGDVVAAGAPLYEIDPKPYKAALDLSKASRAVTVAEHGDALAKYVRNYPLNLSKAVSDEEFGEIFAYWQVSYAKFEASEAAVVEAQLDVDYSSVRSPIAGRVGKTLATVGNYVGGSNATHLTTVVRYDEIYANFTISEIDLLNIMEASEQREGGKRDIKDVPIYLQLGNETGFPHLGRGDYAELGVDQSTGTYTVRGIFPNSDLSILPGMFVRIRIPFGTIKDALLLPERVVSIDQQGRYVLVIGADNKVERRNVTIGLKVADMVVIRSGLEGDEQVVVSGIQRARPGAEVTISDEQLAPPVVPADSQLDMNVPLPEVQGPTRISAAEVELPKGVPEVDPSLAPPPAPTPTSPPPATIQPPTKTRQPFPPPPSISTPGVGPNPTLPAAPAEPTTTRPVAPPPAAPATSPNATELPAPPTPTRSATSLTPTSPASSGLPAAGANNGLNSAI